MSINIHAKTDCSFLFSSLGSGAAGVTGSNFLSDYASIKNGSYAKLMKAYYAKDSNKTVKSLAKDNKPGKLAADRDSKALAKVQTATDALKDSADALLEKGGKSLFTMKDITTKDENGVETTKKGYDVASIYKAVNSFVNNYNGVVNAVDEYDGDAVTRRAQSMVNAATANEKMLNQVGIFQNSDGTLSLDKNLFMKSDMTKVKSLFGGNGSFGYNVSAQASLINYAADRESSRSGFYNYNGNYTNSFQNGNLFNSYF